MISWHVGRPDWRARESNAAMNADINLQNLVGLKLVKGMVVKDLTILRVPFVKPNIPLLDMLNVFQVGMSR